MKEPTYEEGPAVKPGRPSDTHLTPCREGRSEANPDALDRCVNRLLAEREAQGLPRRISDPTILANVAAILRGSP